MMFAEPKLSDEEKHKAALQVRCNAIKNHCDDVINQLQGLPPKTTVYDIDPTTINEIYRKIATHQDAMLGYDPTQFVQLNRDFHNKIQNEYFFMQSDIPKAIRDDILGLVGFGKQPLSESGKPAVFDFIAEKRCEIEGQRREKLALERNKILEILEITVEDLANLKAIRSRVSKQ